MIGIGEYYYLMFLGMKFMYDGNYFWVQCDKYCLLVVSKLFIVEGYIYFMVYGGGKVFIVEFVVFMLMESFIYGEMLFQCCQWDVG